MNESAECGAEIVRREMTRLRGLLNEDALGASAQLHSLTNWRKAVGKHPWGFLIAAAIAGYLVVPRRAAPIRLDSRTIAELKNNLESSPYRPTGNMRPAVASFTGIALQLLARTAANYAVKKLNENLARRGQIAANSDAPRQPR
jgi:hypothetical protein